MVNLTPGKDFQIVIVSIDPAETPAIAAAKKAIYVKRYGRIDTAAGWHFLTGEEPAIRQLTGRQFAAEQSDPLAQSGQAAPAGQGAPRADRKRYRSGNVGHLDLDGVVLVADPDRGRLPGGVLGRVGQAFLHHPVHGQPHVGGQRRLIAVLGQLSRLAAHPGLFHQVPDGPQDGCRRRGRLIGRLQHVQQGTQLRQGPPAGLADGRERGGDAVWRFELELHCAGLDDHGGDVVGHHVVQFARDARPFGGGRQPPPSARRSLPRPRPS